MIFRKSPPIAIGTAFQSQIRRSLAVYAIGDGWTGAMGTGSLDSFVPGHDDDDVEILEAEDKPLLVYEGSVKDVAAGWGHSAFISEDGSLFVSGKPYDFSTLLRTRRLPQFLRKQILGTGNDKQQGFTPPKVIGQILSWMVGKEDGPGGPWEEAERNSTLLTPTRLQPEAGSSLKFSSVAASAGLTALITTDGDLMTFGLNHHGQCGVGEFSNNVWAPQAVVGLSSEFASEGRSAFTQEHPIEQVALGLQHGVALDATGQVFVWGKGERGQLGIQDQHTDSSPFARGVSKFRLPSVDGSQRWISQPRMTKIGAGMNHSVALSEDNLLFVWGKNVAQPTVDGKIADDSSVPIAVKGLPEKQVVDVACASHHTSVLLEDGSVYGFGIPRDGKTPMLEAIEQIPAGVIDMPCRQFEGFFDRTTVVGSDGEQVLHAQLWSDLDMREYGVFTPVWRDSLDSRIKGVHRGWLHTLVVTEF